MYQQIEQAIDHTLLNVAVTWGEIEKLCDEAMAHHTASVCIPPSFVQRAKQYVGERMAICTVIGFPNGYQTQAVKIFETKDAIEQGADEIDMVINVGDVKEGNYAIILTEIKAIKHACGDKCLKVIIETCYLTEGEKIRMCQIVSQSQAEYIKTSTGFGTAGATMADVQLFKQHIDDHLKIKAAGGIKNLAMAQEYLDAGVSRLGSSSLLKMIEMQ